MTTSWQVAHADQGPAPTITREVHRPLSGSDTPAGTRARMIAADPARRFGKQGASGIVVHGARSFASRKPATSPPLMGAVDNRLTAAPMTYGKSVVFVVDDDISVRESLEPLIRVGGWQPEVFASAQAFLARPREIAASCLVLDVNLPELNGLDLQRQIAGERIEMPIIFLSGYADVPMTVQAMKGGAVEFLTKPFNDEVLLMAIRNAIERSRAMLGHAGEIQGLRDRHVLLSRREQEVMALIVAGLLNKQVAFELAISEVTVKAHRGQVMRKMGADSFADLVTMAGKLGLCRSEAKNFALPKSDWRDGTQERRARPIAIERP
jgi:FixJ family two-component response regulator